MISVFIPHVFLFYNRPEVFQTSNSIQFLPYVYGLSVSLSILFENEIQKLSLRPANRHLLVIFSIYPESDTQQCIFLYLHKVPTMASANIMDSATSFLTPFVRCVWGIGMGSRHIMQPHIHVDAVAFACCTEHLCLATSVDSL